MADLREENTYKFLSFMRFVEYDGDMMLLAAAKMKDEQGKPPTEEGAPIEYKAENLSVMSIKNESKILSKIKQMSETYLAAYPNSIEEDTEILARDDKEQYLTFNQRNCVYFRKGEKEILIWFIQFTTYTLALLSMKWKEAKKEA